MKKMMLFTAVAGLCLLTMVSTAQAQWGSMDEAEDGRQVVAAAKYMINTAQKILNTKDADRAKITDAAYQLIKHGYDTMESGEFMTTDDGRNYMGQIGQKLQQSGNVMLKIGRNSGPLTQQEKDSIKKQATIQLDLGKLMLANGQNMGG
jgi:hypothetical protein